MKYLGCAFILIFFLLCAYRSSRLSEEESAQLSELLLFVRYLSSRIGYFMEPLPDIYDSFEGKALEACGFLPAVRAGGDDFASDAIEKLSVSDETKSALAELFADLGKKGAKESLSSLEICEARLREEDEAKRAALPDKTRVIRTLALTAAAMVLILIL